jgi:hypothetical protein
MFHFKNYVMKIISKSPSRHLVTLQGQLKLSGKEKVWHICKFYYIFQYSNILIIKQISVTNLGWSINNVKTFAIIMPKNSVFYKFCFGRGGLQPSSPLGAPMCLIEPVNQKCLIRIKCSMSSTLYLCLLPPPPQLFANSCWWYRHSYLLAKLKQNFLVDACKLALIWYHFHSITMFLQVLFLSRIQSVVQNQFMCL